jgi:hypothetical protein
VSINIMPLVDAPIERGKCGDKLIQTPWPAACP